jgi:SHS2 domain-containing protein
MAYEHMDVSGDAGVRATGATLEEAFASAALGMYSLITDLETIREEKSVRVRAESRSTGELLVGFLNELVFLCDARGFMGRRVDVESLGDNSVEATVTGEDFDPARHTARVLIKAATYHGLRVEEADGGWLVEVIFDI